MAYTLLCGHEPFYGLDQMELKEANKAAVFDFKHPVWRSVSVEAKDWICRALRADPNTRFTPTDALRHTWMTQNSDMYI